MKTKILLAVFFSALSFQAFSTTEEDVVMPAEESAKTISTGRYIGGGLASMIFGFGTGHAIQGRYSERGWIFTVLGFTPFACLAGPALLLTGPYLLDLNPEIPGSFIYITLFGVYCWFTAMTVIKTLELWDIFDYKIVKKSPFEIKPLAFYDPYKKFNYGLSLKYSF